MSKLDSNIESALDELVPSKLDNVVAVETGADDKAEIFIRSGDKISLQTISFSPFLLASGRSIFDNFKGAFTVEDLSGSLTFKHIIRFPNEICYQNCLKYLADSIKTNDTSPDFQYRLFPDMQQQIMMQSGIRLFKKMRFNDVRRLQFDIETLTTRGYDFPNPKREDDRIVVISMSDNTGWEKCLFADGIITEKDILEEFVSELRKRDPDIIEGHNIFRFDLPFIEERARRHKVKLNLGRDGSVPASRNSIFTVAERTLNYRRYDIYGRHIADTNFLAMLYDVSHRSLESLGLKAIAKHFNVASSTRTYIDADNIEEYYANNRDDLLKYAMDDVRETRAISEILSQSYFYQTQLQPYSYQNSIIRGNATKIDSILISAYLSEGHSVPVPEQPRMFTGALTEAVQSGIFDKVWHCDIRSLYPSIILADRLCPSRDKLGKLPFFLSRLRSARLAAKDMEKQASSDEMTNHYNSLQTSLKIMINSFYGYLAFAQGTFNDYEMADKITSKGRELLTLMQNTISSSGAQVIEMDTDGIYFHPPDSFSIGDMKNRIQSALPEGIDVELDSEYTRMFCYKSKNYALLSGTGEITVAGGALKSRGVEPFLREYIKEFLRLLLNRKNEEIEALAEKYRNDISISAIPLVKLAKTETLKESPGNYKKKLDSGKTKRNAAYELALKAQREYRQGDQLTYYVTGNRKSVSAVDNCCMLADAPEIRNENLPYYLSKLEEVNRKFKPFLK